MLVLPGAGNVAPSWVWYGFVVGISARELKRELHWKVQVIGFRNLVCKNACVRLLHKAFFSVFGRNFRGVSPARLGDCWFYRTTGEIPANLQTLLDCCGGTWALQATNAIPVRQHSQ